MVNRANRTRANDHRTNGNRAVVVAPAKTQFLYYNSYIYYNLCRSKVKVFYDFF